jgi:predicted nucleic acid-binding protein
MFLIVDTNVLFSFFHSKSKVRESFKSLRERGVSLLVPQYMFDELLGIKPEILRDCNLSVDEFSVSLALLLKLLEIVPEGEYEEFIEEAKRISPHLKDAPLFALSRAFDKVPIWSREPRLKRQKVVKVLHDKEVVELYFGLAEP